MAFVIENGVLQQYIPAPGETSVTIPDEVTVIAESVFKNCSQLKEVILGNNVEEIQRSAFWGAGMESLFIPASVKKIDSNAFCFTKINSIVFSEGLEIIGDSAFSGCKSLEEIILPNSIIELGREAFNCCSSLKKVTIQHPVSGKKNYPEPICSNVLSAGLFDGCTALEDFFIPNGTVAIGREAFNNCSSLKNINIPDSVESIGDGAFYGCFNLESLTIPANCTEIGQESLPHSTKSRFNAQSAKLSRILVAPKNENYLSLDGILCSGNGDTIIACPAQYNIEDYVMPDGVKEIFAGAFSGCDNIKKVIIAQSVKKIGAKAFSSMTSLEEIVLPSDLPILEAQLFENCERLNKIIWPKNLREIGEKSFANTGIENLAIPDTVEIIGRYAFAGIKARKAVLPKSVKSISLSVFAEVPEIEVYDSIDPDAEPATDHLDVYNGLPNGKVGFIGIYQWENYLTSVGNSSWYEHTITVRAAKDDSIKYVVKMPDDYQTRKVKCVYTSSWGKNASFNFNAVDDIFKELGTEGKFEYFFNRLHWQKGISDEMRETLKKYVARNDKDICARIFKTDSAEDLKMAESLGIVKKNTVDDRIEEATRVNAIKCREWLLNWQNNNISAEEKADKARKTSSGKLSVADIKKIWPNRKGTDGCLEITGYNGRDADAIVPEIIGKTSVTAIGGNCFSLEIRAISGLKPSQEEQRKFLSTELRSVTIPDSVREIGNWTFYGCAGLETVNLPKGLKTISKHLFKDCSNLKIEIPEEVIEIEEDAFGGCPMKSLWIPSSVKKIRGSSFGIGSVMLHLESIDVDPESTYYKSVDGVLLSADGKTLVKYPAAKTSEDYTVPDGVIKIDAYAFANSDKLKHVYLPESVEIIDEYAFYECRELESVHMPSNASMLGRAAFEKCASLKEINIPSGVGELPYWSFTKCSSLTKAVMPEGLEKIGSYAFNDCNSLTDINIPDSVIEIEGRAFHGCVSLKNITISKNVKEIGWFVFGGCKDLIVYTPADSEMYAYAQKNKISVEGL